MSKKKNIVLTPEQQKAVKIMQNQDAINLASSSVYSNPYRSGTLGYGNSDVRYRTAPDGVDMIDNQSAIDQKTKSQINETEEDDDSSMFSWIGDAFNHVGYLGKNGYRKILQDLSGVKLSGSKENLRRDAIDEKIVNMIERRNDLLDKIEKVKSQTSEVYLDFESPGLHNKNEELENLTQQLNNLDYWFKKEGRKYDIVLDNMFDYENTNAGDQIGATSDYLTGGFKNSLGRRTKRNYEEKQTYKQVEDFTMDLLTAFGSMVGHGLYGTGNYLLNATTGFGDDNHAIKSYLKTLLNDTEYDKDLLNKIYKSDKFPQQKINELKEQIKENTEKHKTELNNNLDFAKRGYYHLPFQISLFNNNIEKIKLYEKPDEEWLKHHEAVSESVWNYFVNPIDALSEIGSSIALYSEQIKAMGVEYALQKAGKAFIDLLNPGKKVKLLADSVLLVSDVGQHMYFTSRSREEETKGEAIEAIGERIAQDAAQSGVDLARILPQLKNQLEENGVDTKDLELSDYMALATTFGIKTDDATFNNIVAGSANGIMKVINANNTLAASDYLQSLPMMNYGGKMLGSVTKSMRKELAKITGNIVNIATRNPNAYRSIYRATDNFIHRGLIDAALEKASAKWLKKSPSLLLHGNTFASWLLKKQPYFIMNSIGESVEEGQQYLLQQRYKRGEYDNYNEAYNIFDIRELVGNAELGATSIMDYFGIGFDKDSDSEDLVKAMNIGFASSMAFSRGQHFLTNFTGTRNDNLLGLISNLKADNAVLEVMNVDYDNKNSKMHSRSFYEALKNGKVSASDLIQKLRLIQESGLSKDMGIEDEWIEDDMSLATFMQMALNNPTLSNKKELAKRGIVKGSEDYKKLMVESAMANYNVYKNFRAVQNNAKELDRLIKEKKDIVEQMFSGMSDEQLEKLQGTKFGKIVQRLAERYDTLTETDKQNEATNRSTFRKALLVSITDSSKDYGISSDLVEQFISRTTSGEDGTEVSDDLYNQYAEQSKKDEIRKNLSASNNAVFRYVKSKVWDDSKRDSQNKSAIIQYLNSRKDDTENLINEIYEYNEQNPITKKDFVLSWLTRLDTYKRMQAKTKLRNILSDKVNRLSYLKKLTGLDINIEGLLGMIDTLDEHNEKFKQYYDNSFKGVENIFEEGEWEIENEKEYMDQIMAMAINNSARASLDVAARAFMFGVGAPKSLKDAIYGKNSTNTEFNDIIDEFNTIDADLVSNEMHLTKKDRKNKNKRKKELSKEAAWKYILSRLQTSKDIEHQELVDAAEVIANQTGVPVEQVIQNEEDNVSGKKNTDDSYQKSEDEKKAEQQFGNAGLSENLNNKKQKAIDNARKNNKKSNKESEEESEEESENETVNEEESTSVPMDDEVQDTTQQELEDEEELSEASGDISAAFGHANPLVEGATEQHVSQNDLETPEVTEEESEELDENGWSSEKNEFVEDYNGLIVHTNSQTQNGEIVFNAKDIFSYLKDGIDYVSFIFNDGENKCILNVEPNEDGTIRIEVEYHNDNTVSVKINSLLLSPTISSKDDNPVFIKIDKEGNITDIIAYEETESQETNVDQITPDSMASSEEESEQSDIDDESQEEENKEQEEFDDQMNEDLVEDTIAQESIDELYVIETIIEEEIEHENSINEAIEEEDSIDEDLLFNLLSYDEDGRLLYDGKFVGIETQKLLEEELQLLGKAFSLGISQEELPVGNENKQQLIFNATSDEIGNLISNTFFYQPNALDSVFLSLGADLIYLDKPLASGSQLSEKLSTPGWLDSVIENGGAYYIVTASQDAAKLLNSKSKKVDPRDSLTVSLILEDDTNTYCTTLRNLERITYLDKNGVKHTSKGELDLRNELRRKNMDTDKVASYLNIERFTDKTDIYHKVSQAIVEKQKEYLRNMYEMRYNSLAGFESFYKGEGLNEQQKILRSTWLSETSLRARYFFSKPGKPILSDKAIDAQISALRNLRNEIIQEYMNTTVLDDGKVMYRFKNVGFVEQNDKKYYKVQKTVKPVTVQQSNGKINSIKDEFNNPVFRPITSSKTVQEVNTMIDNGELILGYGRGLAVRNDPWSISNLFGEEGNIVIEGNEVKHCGLSGKIYWIVKNPFDLTRNPIPIMLSEEKFDFQTTKDGKTHWLGNIDDLHLCLNVNESGEVEEVDPEYNPSAAEVLLYMMCGKINTGTSDNDQLQNIVEFFIHHGENTLFEAQPRYAETGLNNFAMKQLHISFNQDGSKTLFIALPQRDVINGNIIYQQAVIENVDKVLFASDENSVALRRQVVHAIATQMHWNTDIKHMQSTISSNGTDDISNFVRYLIDKNCKPYNECDSVEEYLNQTVSILNCPQLTFKLSDFFEDAKGERGLAVKSKPVNVASWMIQNMKLKTDVGEKILKDPFVFASGVQKQSQLRKEVEQKANKNSKTENKPNPVTSKVESEVVSMNIFDMNKVTEEGGISDMLGIDSESVGISNSEAERQKFLDEENANSNWLKSNGYTLLDKIISYSKDENVTADQLVERFINDYNKTHDDKITKINGLSEDENYTYSQEGGVVCLTVVRTKDGDILCNASVLNLDDFNNDSTDIRYSGVYSQVKGSGNVEIEKARNWLYKKLGISPYNVVLTNAIMRGAQNEKIFGVTNTAVDILTREITGTITLSSMAGKGIHYHEAWHYVNLLMHSREERIALYEAYLNRHYLYALTNPTYAQVEERMAEDFRKYSEGIEDTSIIGKVKQFFRNVLDFLCIATADSKQFYTQVYEAIHSGEYNPQNGIHQLNQQEISKFADEHPFGVYTVVHDIAGITKQQREKLKSIQTYQQFYDSTEAVVDYIINGMHLDNVDNVRSHVKTNFNKSFERAIDQLMQKDINSKDQKKYEMLEELKNNPDIVEAVLFSKLEELGFRIKVRKILNVKEGASDEEQTAEDPDNYWDKLDITSSKKDNASASTKLFMRSIPKYSVRVNYNEETKEYENKYVPETSNFGVTQSWSYDEAWNKILNELWSCTSYGKLLEDGKTYDPRSIRGRVKQLVFDPFFYALDKKLDTLDARGKISDNTQLKSQIFATVNSYKNPVSYIVLSDAMNLLIFEDEEDYEEDDLEEDKGFTYVRDERKRNWKMNDDGALKASLSIPRTWSKTFASQGYVYYDKTNKQSVSSKNKMTHLMSILAEIQNKLGVIDSQFVSFKKNVTDKQQRDKYLYDALYGNRTTEGLVHKVIKLANLMGMPIDIQTLDVLSQQLYADNKTAHQKMYDTIKYLTKQNGSKGSISDILTELNSSSNIQATFVTINNKKKTLDSVYTAYNHKSAIAKLALAYNAVHPSLNDYVVKSPNNESIYPINMNNYVTDVTRDLSDKTSGLIEDLEKSPYCWNSLILEAARKVNPSNEESKLRVKSFIGMKDNNANEGADYFGITPMEDYLAKMFMTMNDQIIFPTMADKKKWYSLTSSNIKLCHDNITHVASSISFVNARNAAFDETELGKKMIEDGTKFTTNHFGDEVLSKEYKQLAYRWFNKLMSSQDPNDRKIVRGIHDVAIKLTLNVNSEDIQYRRFSDNTINIFAGYFMDELNSLIAYYSKENIANLLANPNSRLDNFHGKATNPQDNITRLSFDGNGGKFRYFADVNLGNLPGVKIKYKKNSGNKFNLNHHLQALFELQKKIEFGKEGVKDENYNKLVSNKQNLSLNEIDNDGFELIRDFLQTLKNQVFTGAEGQYTQVLTDAMNEKLISMVDAEMDKISEEGSAIQICKKVTDNFTGQTIYIPTKVPTQFMKKHADALSAAKLASYGNVYDQNGLMQRVGQSQILYSTIANYVVNSAISTIEVEKIYSGDPAFYKMKSKSSEKVTLEYTDGTQKATVTVDVDNMTDPSSDKIKRLGGLLSPGTELRLDYSSQELKKDPRLYATQYTNLNVEDIYCQSMYYDQVKNTFKAQLIVNEIRVNEKDNFIQFIPKIMKMLGIQDTLSLEDAISYVYSNEQVREAYFNTLSSDTKDKINRNLDQQTAPYSNINVCDAQVFIRPELYRKIRIGLGEWSFKTDSTGYSDEIAYKIIEQDRTWMSDPNKAKIVQKFQLYALKMSYFGHENRRFTEQFNANIPIYNKMAIFPMFKFHATTDIGAKIYNRMNLAGQEIDMIAFKSAVKVGGTQKGSVLNDRSASPLNALSQITDMLDINPDGTAKYVNSKTIDYTNDVVTDAASDKTLGITVQKLKNIRMQLNTHAHEADSRAVGTQMFKIAFSNVVDDAWYGNRQGKDIRKDIMDCINSLTLLGVLEIYDRFYQKDENGVYQIDDTKVANYMQKVVESNGLGTTAEEIIANGGVAAGLMSRIVFENSMSVIVNDAVVNINSKGGTAIQQSVFGFSQIEGSNVQTNGIEGEVITDGKGKTTVAHSYHDFNDGKELVWNEERGTMEVLLSMNFFKSVVPSDFSINYDTMRQWLINHDVIKGTKFNISITKKDGTVVEDTVDVEGSKSNPKPFGIGYRIPTQGQSSMFAYTVADVLPEQVGDLIVVPREFTAQTGSDFDVDKIYLANISYKNGDIVNNDNTKEGLTNRLLYNYMQIITDIKNYADARASIDTITNKIQDELLDVYLRDKPNGSWVGMTELMPSYQALRKMEFGVGKTGIGPFALNVTNLALTQFTHLTFDYGSNPYGFGNLDETLSKDGTMIAAWLSAMVNAHVDVAKDPYVFMLNVNQTTYNHANFLLRAGMGISTFHFLSQPILKEYANLVNLSSGIYSGNSAVKNGDISASSASNYAITNDLYKRYVQMLERSGSKEGYVLNAILYFKSKYDSEVKSNLKASGVKIGRPIPKSRMFEPTVKFGQSLAEISLASIKQNKEEAKQTGILKDPSPESIIYQLCALETFNEIDQYAKGISKLIQCSQVDTKKFGNTIVKQRNWKNKYDQFKYGFNNNFGFIINTDEFEKKYPLGEKDEGKFTASERSVAALNTYFEETFLLKKLDSAIQFTRETLKGQLISATDEYMNMFENLCKLMSGEANYKAQDPIEARTNPKEEVSSYNLISNEDVIQELGNKLDNIFRYRAMTIYGQKVYDPNSSMIDFTMRGNVDAVINKMNTLLFGNENQKSIFERLNELIVDINVNPNKKVDIDLGGKTIQTLAYANLRANGKITNDLLSYIMPMMPTVDFPVGKIYLMNPLNFTQNSLKRRYQTAFNQLLQHKNPEIRQLAEDLAFYAYYSTYDQNTSNSFFDLVPFEYRKQYDYSLKMYLNESNNKQSKEVQQEASNIMDIICRNFWYDNAIVPVYYPVNEDSFVVDDDDLDLPDPFSGFKKAEVTIGGFYDEKANISFPSAILSTKIKSNNKTKKCNYIKLLINNVSYLYKHAGKILRTTKRNDKVIEKDDVDIFVVVPKAGLHSNRQNQFEFYVDDNHDSIFEQNMLPGDFAEDIIRQLILDRITKTNGIVSVNGEQVTQNESNDTYNIVYFNPELPSSRTSSNINTYYTTSKEVSQNTDRQFGFIKLNEQSTTPSKTAKDNASVVVNLTMSAIERENKNDKIIDVVLGDDVQQVAEDIAKVLENNDGVICFDSFLENYQFGLVNSDNEYGNKIFNLIKQYSDDYIAQFESDLNSQNIDDEQKQAILNSELLSVQNGGLMFKKFRDMATQLVLNDYLAELVKAIYDARGGNKIVSVSAIADKNKTFVARAVNNSTLVCEQYIQSKSNLIFIQSGQNTDFKRSPQFRKFKRDIQNDISRLYTVTSKVTIMSEPISKPKVIDETTVEDVQDVEFTEIVNNTIVEDVKKDNDKKNEECSSNNSENNKQQSNTPFDPFGNGNIIGGDLDD